MQEIVNSFVSKVYLNSEIKEKKIVIVKHRKPSSPIELPCTQQWKTEDFDLGQYILTFLCTFTPKPHYTFCSFYFLFSAILHLLSLSLIPPPPSLSLYASSFDFDSPYKYTTPYTSRSFSHEKVGLTLE